MAVTPVRFRELALALPKTEEHAHSGHPDFRVAGNIFATLGYPDAKHGMVKLSAEEQRALIKAHPHAFCTAGGAWGKHGSTLVRLAHVSPKMLEDAIKAAWFNVAPKGLHDMVGNPPA